MTFRKLTKSEMDFVNGGCSGTGPCGPADGSDPRTPVTGWGGDGSEEAYANGDYR